MSAQATDATSHQQPIVWLLSDNQPGHLSQLKGLSQRLTALCGARIHWVECQHYPVPLWRWILGRPPEPSAPRPDLIIGAGRRTHRLLHALSRYHNAGSVVLMRPALPVSCFDAVIIPAHDHPPKRSNVFTSLGAINKVQPLPALTDRKQGLILLGGPSRHFHWSDELVQNQVQELCRKSPDWQWHLSSSRRTPTGLMDLLAQTSPDNLCLHHHATTPPDWLPQQLAQSRLVWVSPDSVSMVCEALTAGVTTGLFDLKPVRGSRVVRAITELHAQEWVITWPPPQTLFDHPPAQNRTLWEADRAARWLIKRFNLRTEATPAEGAQSHD